MSKHLMISPNHRLNPVILMAGGLGSRLKPLTDECPKPMLSIGGRPILETILMNFIEHGFHQFYIAVNYKSDVITRYFGDGQRYGVEIQYLYESERMGTVGALSLLPEIPKMPFFVMNSDLLTSVNFTQMLAFHEENKSIATMGIRKHYHQIPYGVLNLDQHRITRLIEKPIEDYFVNAGIYILSPNALDFMPKNCFYDMPDLFNSMIRENQTTCAFPLRDYWLDIGKIEDFERANQAYSDEFALEY